MVMRTYTHQSEQASLIFYIFTYFTRWPLTTRYQLAATPESPFPNCLTLCAVPVPLRDHRLPRASPLPTLTVYPKVRGALPGGERRVFAGWGGKESAQHHPLEAAPGGFQASWPPQPHQS